ncbi:MAG: hypothetical protein D3907_03550, partial [Candidatus Electrothrix sp. AUS3]|nr:hypothetical protein [Candidatus Electrothrix gigas]
KIGLDFWRGFEITWTELDMGADVHRGELAEKLKSEVTERLGESRNVSVPLYHYPGAGGTTLAKRIAWDLKGSYPTVRIHHLSQYTVNRIERLFHITGLPVLAIIESANVPQPAREDLYKELKGRNCRAVFLYIVRAMNRQGEFYLGDVMSEQEAKRFYHKYREVALPGRDSMLKNLAENKNDAWSQYRLPFFFGLYAFEDKFVHVPDFLRAHLEDIQTSELRELVCFLALVTRYAQSFLTDDLIKALLDIPKKSSLRIEEYLGLGAARLVLYRAGQLRIIHPLIAYETLKQLLKHNGDDKSGWKTGLADICCSFVEATARIGGSNSDTVLKILMQMFISRDHWQEDRNRRHFSGLILEIPNQASRHRVLTQLTESYPDEAHFWNHLGRHHIYEMRSVYTEAEHCLKEAIRLDEANSIHYHALGLVYRYQIQKHLDNALRDQKRLRVSIDSVLFEVKEIITQAEEAFTKSRELDPETDYGYITHIQLITRVIESFFQLSEKENYAAFLEEATQAASWCLDKIPVAEDLLMKVKS